MSRRKLRKEKDSQFRNISVDEDHVHQLKKKLIKCTGGSKQIVL